MLLAMRTVLGLMFLGAVALAQSKTPWGDPDLQGVWPGTDMVGTPLERPKNFGTSNVLTDEEFAQRQARAKNAGGDRRAGNRERRDELRSDPRRIGKHAHHL